MSAGRTLHVRCTTWEQVEIFYTRKLRRGKLLSLKVPFPAELGAQLMLGLELPNQIVIAIEGRVQRAQAIDGEAGKTWIELELVGFTDEVIARIKAMMTGAALPDDPTPPPMPPPIVPEAPRAPRPPPPSGDELPADERLLFTHLTSELRRLRQLAVHEVLGVDRDADAEAIRLGWMRLVRRHHPDLVARHQAPAITHLAEELTILCNRAYDRLRAAMVLEGRATSVGSVLQPPAGWLVGFDDIASRGAAARDEVPTLRDEVATEPDPALAAPTVPPPPGAFGPTTYGLGASGPVAGAPAPSAVQGGEAFESRARAMLFNGESDHAQEVLAAALCVYPRSRPLRSLYYVASALAALSKGEKMLATSQLETALAHYEHCLEAAQILEYMRRNANAGHEELRRFFR
jgi:DnaJ-domain-containing protein 1